MATADPDPICQHPDLLRRVTNQRGPIDWDRAHRSVWVCADAACILDARAWVERGTGERAFVFDTRRQLVSYD